MISGALKGGTFFRCTGVRLAPKAMRNALEFELPQRLLQDAGNHELEFVELAGDPGSVPVNVYTFPSADLENLAAMITQSVRKADYFIYPLLALRESDGPVFLPEDSSFQPREWLGCLLTARLAASDDVRHTFGGLNVLPKQLRPSRLRNQLRLTALLIVLLIANFGWGIAGQLSQHHKEYSSLVATRNRLRTQVTAAQRKLKTAEKELRELSRVVNQSAGEYDVIGKLAEFSSVLPNNVMVMNLRWTDSSVDLTMRSEAESLNVPEMLRPLKFWKMEQIQQRRRNNDVTSMIMLKLVPAEEKK